MDSDTLKVTTNSSPKILINGEEASLSHEQYLSFHGNSVFTTLRSIKKEPALWDSHWQRLAFSADYFSFYLPNEKKVYDEIVQNLKSFTNEQKIRVILNQKSYALTFENFIKPDAKIYSGVKTIYSSILAHDLLGQFKTGNSLLYHMAKKSAEEQGAFEALLCNSQGFVVDGSRTSVLHLENDCLISLEGGLKGCMREEVMRYAKHLGLKTKRGFLKPENLHSQIFLANSLMGLVPVDSVKNNTAKDLVDRFKIV